MTQHLIDDRYPLEAHEFDGWGWGHIAQVHDRPLYIRPIGAGLYTGTRDRYALAGAYNGYSAAEVVRWFAHDARR